MKHADEASPVQCDVRHRCDPCRCGDETTWHDDCYLDEDVAKKRAWLRALPAPEHTYDWEEHPDGYDDACCCASCRSYAAQDV